MQIRSNYQVIQIKIRIVLLTFKDVKNSYFEILSISNNELKCYYLPLTVGRIRSDGAVRLDESETGLFVRLQLFKQLPPYKSI